MNAALAFASALIVMTVSGTADRYIFTVLARRGRHAGGTR